MKVNFLVADEFRTELSGKQMVLGLYADGIILLEPASHIETSIPNLPEGIDRLAFLINISDAPEMKHNYKGQIIDPSGNPHGSEIPFGEFEIAKNTSRSFIAETKPFLFHGKGTYHFNFYVDDVLYSFPFSLIDKVQKKQSVSS